jgi:hypothetical protein
VLRRTLAAVLVLAACLGAFWLGAGVDRGRAVPTDPIGVSPVAGADSAAPETQISFRGRSLRRLGRIEVSGSRTGRHAGRLAPHADGDGASFLPDEPFAAGETVTVRTGLPILGARAGDFRFTVGRPAGPPDPRVDEAAEGDVQSFRSRPDLVVPAVEVLKRTGEASRGSIFIAPKRGAGLNGPVILDGRGRLVWAREVPEGRQATDFRVQRYRGRPVLTWWEGGTNVGVGFGEGVILDRSYREVMRVRMGNGQRADLHEFQLTRRGTALMIGYAYLKRDLSEVGGSRDGAVIDGVVQEVDLRTGLVVFEWRGLDHVGLEESGRPVPKRPGEPYDYLHLNSVTDDTDGDLLLSARNTSAVYKVDRTSGSVLWRLGGRKSDFALDADTRFGLQHDVRRRRDGALTLFDNSAGPPKTRDVSRALALDLDTTEKTARVARSLVHPRRLSAANQGSTQSLRGDRTFVGWGPLGVLSEFTGSGRLVFDARLAKGNDTYRAYRAHWAGRPATRPRVAVAPARRGVRAYASWNGATGVGRWQALTGRRRDALRPVGDAPRRGFETAIPVVAPGRYIAVRALSASGRPLATSDAIRVPA